MKSSEIQLHSGETIRCKSIQQGHTYERLLEGVPGRHMNENILQRLLEKEKEGWWGKSEPYLVPPMVRPIDGDTARRYAWGEPEEFPHITCVARFSGPSEVALMAELVVIWFQDEFAFPIQTDIVEHLGGIDWARLAIPYDP